MEKSPDQLEIVLRYFTEFSPVQLRQLAALDQLYKEWNAKINVISRKDIDGLYEKHILHSLAIAAVFDFPPGSEVIDIGTGGGFPGIPLAIFFPDTRFHLVDSIGKKLKVVEAVAEATGLTNISTQHGRAEEIKNRKFDCAVSRAVAPLKDLWTWSRPLLRKSGEAGFTETSEKTSWLRGKPTRPATIPPSHPAATPPSHSPGVPPHTHAGTSPHPANAVQPHPVNTPSPKPSGLICLKGGDLAAEISASGCRPKILEIHELFPLEYFREKFLLHVPF